MLKGRILIWLAVTIVLIGWDGYRRRDIRKSLIASATFVWITVLAAFGISMRPILPLFAVHYLAILAAWGALILYLWRGIYLRWVFALPLLTAITFLGLNFLEGSRYES